MNNEYLIGEKIKLLRKSMGLTQEQLSEKAGIDHKYLSKIENGLHLPTYKTIAKLSNALNYNLEILDKEFVNCNTNQNPNYSKALKILNSAENDSELLYYLQVLKLAQKGLSIREIK